MIVNVPILSSHTKLNFSHHFSSWKFLWYAEVYLFSFIIILVFSLYVLDFVGDWLLYHRTTLFERRLALRVVGNISLRRVIWLVFRFNTVLISCDHYWIGGRLFSVKAQLRSCGVVLWALGHEVRWVDFEYPLLPIDSSICYMLSLTGYHMFHSR